MRDLLQLLLCGICKRELCSTLSMEILRMDSPASYGFQGLLDVTTLIEGISMDVDLFVSIT